MRAVAVIGLILLIGLSFSGCAQHQRSTVIDTDKLGGYASGEFRENSSGPSGRLALGGSGYGAGGSGAGFGVGWVCIETGPPKSGAYDFARAIAMVNYSKKLKSIKYDEYGGVIAYEFEQMPVSSLKSAYQAPETKPKLPSSFGHQPVE
jgi:hypothetical protein